MSETQTPPPPAEDENTTAKRYAVYDTVLMRFRGRVHDTRSAADDHRKTLSDSTAGNTRGRFEVRPV